jgi:Arc/MetJ-type ribon-helix-helix transcriptional regulator
MNDLPQNRVSISNKLYKKIQHEVSKSEGEFQSVDEYIEFVLWELVKEGEQKKKVYSSKQEEEVKQRLQDLGYL